MELLIKLIDFILHIDSHLENIIAQYGVWTLAILFLIVFLETGFVVTPFLPGDSLIFAADTFAARGAMDPWLLFFLLSVADCAWRHSQHLMCNSFQLARQAVNCLKTHELA